MAKKNSEYLINNKPVPSVTKIISVIHNEGLLRWYGKLGLFEAEKQKNLAASFGDTIHTGIEALVNGQKPTYSNDRIMTTLNNFEAWSKENIKEWIGFEKAVYHDDLLYAGTTDAFAILKDGRKIMLDFKTSRKFSSKFSLQLTAYINATRIEDNIVDLKNLDQYLVLHLNHETLTWSTINIIPTDELFEVFKSCLKIYNWIEQNG